MKSLWIYTTITLSILFAGCDRDEIFEFPYVPINLSLGIISDLGTLGTGQSVFWPGYGVQGLIIYRSFNDEYFVFDRACTYESDHSCALNDYEGVSGLVKCPCCESSFLVIQEGDVHTGPASHPLVRYSAREDRGFLRINN